MAKRIWIVWQASLGRTEPEITADISLARRSVQQWVQRYNEEGLVGLQDRSGRGRKPPLSPAEEVLFRQRIEAEPQLSDEVCSWRGVDCQRFLETQFGQQKSLSAMSWLLHRLGYEWLVPRPQHKKSDPTLRPLSKTSSRTDCRDRSPASGQEDRLLLPRRMPLRTTRDADSQMGQAWFTTHRSSANGVQRPLGDCRRESPDRSSRSDSLTGVEYRDHQSVLGPVLTLVG